MISLVYLLSLSDDSDHDKIMALYAFHDDMIKLAKKRLRQAELPNYEYEAEDAVQSAFEYMIRHIDSINFSVSQRQMKVYVLSVLINEINTMLNKHISCENIEKYEFMADEDDITDVVQTKDDYNKVIKTIKSMDEKYSTVLICRYVRDMDTKTICNELGISETVFYSRLYRGKEMLKKALKEVCDRIHE